MEFYSLLIQVAPKWLLILALLFVSACAPAPVEPPKLVSLATIAPGTKGAIVATDAATESESVTPTPTILTLEVTMPSIDSASPTEAAMSMVTETDVPEASSLPSFTPRPTFTPSPTKPTPTASRTKRPTRTPSPTPPAQTYTPQPCTIEWFFTPRPAECPLSKSANGPAVFQKFEHGLMIWVGPQNTIFVMYDTPKKPRWQQFTDAFTAGMPESDPSIAPPGGLLQPIRGFGLVWRGKPGVRDRLGWAQKPETPYTAAFQIDSLGNRYIQSITGEVYKLTADLSNWQVVH